MNRQFKLNLSVVTAVSLMIPAPLVFAQGLNTQNSAQLPVSTTTTTGTGVNAQNTQNIPKMPVGMSNIEAQALEAYKKQKQAQMMSMAGAAFSAAMAAVTCPQKPPNPICPMAILGAMASLAIAGKMGSAGAQSLQGYNNVTDGTQNIDGGNSNNNAQTERQVTEAAKQAGLTPDMRTGTLKFPDGRTIGVEDLANDKTMKDAGMTNAEIAGFNDVFSKAMAEGQKAAAKDATKGGSSYDGGGAGGGEKLKTADDTASGNGVKVDRDPAQIAGLSKNYNGDRIGVASENLFTLINRRYEHKGQQNIFLTPAPATTTKSQ